MRNKEKAAQLTDKYPKVRVVHGDLDSSDVIEEEVKNADIVFREPILSSSSREEQDN